jgi:hypothetical protein
MLPQWRQKGQVWAWIWEISGKIFHISYWSSKESKGITQTQLTWVPSRPANGESFTPKVIEIVGGSNSTVGNADII